MEFFGDRERDEDPRDVVTELEDALRRAAVLAAGPVRHGALAAALVRAGELAQGLGDAGADDDGGNGPPARAAMQLVARLGRSLWRSWRSGGRATPPPPGAVRALLEPHPLPQRVRIRQPEGYSLYALYPEEYALAARALGAAGRDAIVLGLRSIGTGLAAMVAAGAGSRRTPFTVRPSGHPWRRRVDLPRAVAEELEARSGANVAVVDEGPGLSGSSIAAAARAALDAGVAPERIHLFTGHAWPPGVNASPEIRAVFERLPRHFEPFEALFLAPGPLAVTRLAEDVIGPARLLEDVTGGSWRGRVFSSEDEWPPSEGWLERRKLLLEASGRRWLARFVGLGAIGERKLARAVALADAGLGVRPAALRHGLLVEPWLEDARPLTVASVPGAAVLGAVRRLVALSAARPRPACDGAPPAELVEMARVNAGEALGHDAAEAARRLEELLPEVEAQARPVEVDGKLQRWEWLVLPGARVVKADGLDHHAGHDLAGCQDALWDVAGAELELGLAPAETTALAEAARTAGAGADPSLLPFYRACFAALEVGRWWYAAANEPPGPERGRREAALARYRRALGRALVALRRPRLARARPEADGTAPGIEPA